MTALVTYTVRACLPFRRRIAVAAAAAVAVLFGLLATTDDAPAAVAFDDIAANAIFTLVIPIACLLVGDAVLGAEVRSGTMPFTWLSPVPFWRIIVARWLAGWGVACAALVPACVLAAFVAGAGERAVPIAIGAAASCAGYVAVFIAIGSVTRRAAVWSLAFVFLVERLLGEALTGIAQLSPSWLGREAFLGFADPDVRFQGQSLAREGIPSGWAAVVRIAMVSVAVLVVATRRLGRVPLARSD